MEIQLLQGGEAKKLGCIFSNAYTGRNVTVAQSEEKIALQNEYSFVHFYGVYQKDCLVGGMRIHDFQMNLLQQPVSAGGIGSVGVDLLHKKEKVAYEIIGFFLQSLRDKGASIAILYPFDPVFYKKMGFGFGTSIHEFRIEPKDFPKGPSKQHICRLTVADAQALCQFYNAMAGRTNGLLQKCPKEFERLLSEESHKIFGYKANHEIQGYCIFHFQNSAEHSFLVNDLYITELLFENQEVFLELMTFFNSQNDQVRYAYLYTQDDNFRFCLQNPINHSNRLFPSVYHESSKSGTGILYRVTDLRKLFEDLQEHNFGHQSCKLKLTVQDDLIAQNNGGFSLYFDDGKLYYFTSDFAETEVELTLKIEDFSSLITCSVDLKSLCRYGIAKLSDEAYLPLLQSLFETDEKPKCFTAF